MMKSPAATEKKEDRRVRRTKKLLTQALTQFLQEKQILFQTIMILVHLVLMILSELLMIIMVLLIMQNILLI